MELYSIFLLIIARIISLDKIYKKNFLSSYWIIKIQNIFIFAGSSADNYRDYQSNSYFKCKFYLFFFT